MESSRKGSFGKGGNGGGFRKTGGFNDRKPFQKSFGDRPSFKKKTWDNGPKSFHNDDREMFQATCSGCGKNCQVPFKPSQGKPVFCDDCFTKTRNGESSARTSSYGNDRFSKQAPVAVNSNNDVVARQLQVISGKLDQLIELMASKTNTSKPEKITDTKPVVAAKKTVDTADLKATLQKAVKSVKKVAVKKAPAKKVIKKK